MLHFVELIPKVIAPAYHDLHLLAKAPLMPNLYRVNLQGHNLGLFQQEGQIRFLLVTDDEQFWQVYRSYYEMRFDIIRHEGDYQVPLDYNLIYGTVKFSEGAGDTEAEESEVH